MISLSTQARVKVSSWYNSLFFSSFLGITACIISAFLTVTQLLDHLSQTSMSLLFLSPSLTLISLLFSRLSFFLCLSCFLSFITDWQLGQKMQQLLLTRVPKNKWSPCARLQLFERQQEWRKRATENYFALNTLLYPVEVHEKEKKKKDAKKYPKLTLNIHQCIHTGASCTSNTGKIIFMWFFSTSHFTTWYVHTLLLFLFILGFIWCHLLPKVYLWVGEKS